MDVAGYRIVMENRTCIISMQNRMLLKAPLVEGMYRIISESTALYSLRERHTRVPISPKSPTPQTVTPPPQTMSIDQSQSSPVSADQSQPPQTMSTNQSRP